MGVLALVEVGVGGGREGRAGARVGRRGEGSHGHFEGGERMEILLRGVYLKRKRGCVDGTCLCGHGSAEHIGFSFTPPREADICVMSCRLSRRNGAPEPCSCCRSPASSIVHREKNFSWPH